MTGARVEEITVKDGVERRRVWTAQDEDPILQHFAYQHLPENLRAVSQAFAELARDVVANLPRNAERSACLRKLLEAKDAAVRARLHKD